MERSKLNQVFKKTIILKVNRNAQKQAKQKGIR